MEEVFCQNFIVSKLSIGDEPQTLPLKEGGEDIMVTEENRREFVDLYIQYYLNHSIHKPVGLKCSLARRLG